MNILFLTLGTMESVQQPGIYTDLLRTMAREGHRVYVVTPVEKATGQETQVIEDGNVTLLRLKVGNIKKVKNIIEKGLSTVRISSQYIAGIKTYFSQVRFDRVVYSTPPITFYKVIRFVKQRDGAKTYLLLKDIFPQNAVDIGMMSKRGVKGLIYRYFRRQEKKLYAISDRIGCMSQANVEYVLRHNRAVAADKIEVCPNCLEVRDVTVDSAQRAALRQTYGIPTDKTVFVYGGNLGKPQGIPFVIECLRRCDRDNAFFLIVGDGTEYDKLEAFVTEEAPPHVKLMRRLPREDYNRMIAACDVGLIFLDHRFTIPNFPSRLLSYMQAALPVLACTDPNTDIGQVVEAGGFGWWCESNDAVGFATCVQQALAADRVQYGQTAQAYLNDHYSVEKHYARIVD